MTLDPEELRSAMRAWSAGVTIVAAAHNGSQHGMTVNSFTSISLDPAWITISLQSQTRTRELIQEAGAFGLTILALDQIGLSERFAGRTPESEVRLSGLETETLITGSPLIKGGLAYLDCRVVQTIPVGMNVLFIGEVVAARGEGKGRPLIYHDRKYWALSEL